MTTLKIALEEGVPVIELTNDITVNETLYVNNRTLLTSKTNVKVIRDEMFGSDVFVVGFNKYNHDSISSGHQSVLSIKPADGFTITLDGNSDSICESLEPTVTVSGSMIFAASSSIINIYSGVRIVNNTKVDNALSYNYSNKNAAVDEEGEQDEPYLSSPERVGGAAIVSIFSEINVYGGLFDNNCVNDKTNNDQLVSSVGGVIFSLGTTTIYDGTFTNNKGLYGSVIYSYRRLYIYKGTFENNYAYDYGALYIPNSQYAELSIDSEEEVTFRNNTAASSGGAIFGAIQAALHIKGAIFDGNTATSNGGAIASKGILSISDCRFENNSCGSKGGAIYSYYGSEDDSTPSRTVTIANSYFENNTAPLGGAVGLGSSIDDTNYPNYTKHVISKITNCAFFDNHAVKNASDKYGHGGALYITKKATCEISSTRFESNDAVGYGGVVYMNDKSTLTMKDASKVIGNFATRGGGIYASDGGIVNVVDSEFAGNASSGDGACLYVYTNASCTLTNVIAQNNSANGNGGFIYMSGASTCKIYDIYSFRNSANSGGFIYITTTNTTLYIYSGSSKECTSVTENAEGIYSNTNKTKIYIKGTDTKEYFDYDGSLMSGKYVLGGI